MSISKVNFPNNLSSSILCRNRVVTEDFKIKFRARSVFESILVSYDLLFHGPQKYIFPSALETPKRLYLMINCFMVHINGYSHQLNKQQARQIQSF
jgi:hypothetical protein